MDKGIYPNIWLLLNVMSPFLLSMMLFVFVCSHFSIVSCKLCVCVRNAFMQRTQNQAFVTIHCLRVHVFMFFFSMLPYVSIAFLLRVLLCLLVAGSGKILLGFRMSYWISLYQGGMRLSPSGTQTLSQTSVIEWDAWKCLFKLFSLSLS